MSDPRREPTSVRTTASVCDVCHRDVPAWLERREADVQLVKRCPEHGERRVLMSTNGDAFVTLDTAFHTVFPPDGPVATRESNYVFITNACNQNCPFCLNEANEYPYFDPMSEEDFAALVHGHEGAKVGLIGGEPTRHEKFFRFVEIIATAGKTAVVYSNGIALANREFVERLAATCPSVEVRVAFEGFDDADYAHLPNPRLRQTKLAALANLEAAGIPVTLGHTLLTGQDAGRQRDRLRGVIEYAMAHPFVKGVTFQGIVALGASRDAPVSDAMPVDRLMDLIVDALPIQGRRLESYVTQRLLYVVAWLFRLPICAYVQTVLLFRSGARWVGLDHFVDTERLDRRLARRVARWPSSRLRTVLGLAIDVLVTARWVRLPALLRVALGVLPVFLRRYDLGSIPSTVLPIMASAECDPFLFDAAVGRRCEKSVHSTVRGDVRSELCSQMLLRQIRERRRSEVGGANGGP